ncbi:MAG: hypothetical protein ACRDD2_10620 [Sarcina sp.]
MRGKVFLNNFAKVINSEEFRASEIKKDNLLRNRLFFFLKTMGYGYASLGILRRIVEGDRKTVDDEIMEILEDCNLRKKLSLNGEKYEKEIIYDRNLGLNKSFKIKYKNLSTEIEQVLWGERDIITCYNRGDSIEVNIKLLANGSIRGKKEELIAVIIGKKIKKYNLKIIEANSSKSKENKLFLPLMVNKIGRKMELNNFPLYDLIKLESEFVKAPFVTTNTLDLLKELYFQGYYSSDSLKVIKILNKTIDIDSKKEDLLLIESRFGEYDVNFLKRLTEGAREDSSDKLDFIINKVINGKFKFYEPFLEVIYKFYKKNNDMNALLRYIELCEIHNIALKKYGFTDLDNLKVNAHINNMKKMGYKIVLGEKS